MIAFQSHPCNWNGSNGEEMVTDFALILILDILLPPEQG